ncbi:MAG: DUF3141 domain-containing protein [Pseudomonadota bacterium]
MSETPPFAIPASFPGSDLFNANGTAPNLGLHERFRSMTSSSAVASQQTETLLRVMSRRLQSMANVHGERTRATFEEMSQIAGLLSHQNDRGRSALTEYLTDAAQRAILTTDMMRERGDIAIQHEADGLPPVLVYDYEVVVDGRDLKRPVNYMLLSITPPEGVTTHDWKRPYVVVDPRAGHGAGIGGFKPDSQVGVALADGHPVYFVAFRPLPENGQTLADVTHAEAAFLKEIHKRHPDSPRPIVVGNCQGGWATMLVAATNPDITGPIVINGAPLAYWSGEVGENPMRYNGGLLGGALPAIVLSDLGNGVFDGANLVMNFEMLNPGRTLFRKYFDAYAGIDTGRDKFLEFERWWGGFYMMNEAEIHWIVEQLFVGNRLARGEARLERGRHLDLKQIRSPIIVFASHGDNITPPQQALNWIVDTYADENEIRIRGQRIIYMVHNTVGHLGIFVSSSVAKREHTEMASTLKTIEALRPGLYEMVIEQQIGEGVDAQFVVSFEERSLSDISTLDDGREEEEAFAAVARLSELGTDVYDLTVRPFVQASATPVGAEMMRKLHPMRTQRTMWSSQNPVAAMLPGWAETVAQNRKPVDDSNPYLRMERLYADMIEQSFDLFRDMRDAAYELMFFGIYSSPFMHWLGQSHAFQRTRKDVTELRFLPEVEAALMNIDRGGFEEAVIRMLITLADARGAVRRSRLERSAKVLSQDEPFKSLGPELRARLIHEQTLIVTFERDAAVNALTELLDDPDERKRAVDVVEFIAGPLEEMEPNTIHTLQLFREVLGLPKLEARAVTQDPLAEGTAEAAE